MADARERILGVFEFLGLEPPDEARLDRIAGEIDSGDRNIRDVRNDLLQFIANERGVSIEEVTGELVRDIFEDTDSEIATEEETEEERINRIVSEVLEGAGAGDIDTGRTFFDIRQSLEDAGEAEGDGGDGSTTIQDIVLPSDVTRLLKVVGEDGVNDEYYVQGDVFGQTFSFLVGDRAAFEAMFPDGEAGFDGYETITRSEFINSDLFGFVAGTIDDIQGSTETLQGQIQRDLEALGLTELPSWIRDDPEAMLKIVTANNQGWSPGQLSIELSETAGFKARFAGFHDWFNEEEHGTIGGAIERWVGLEGQFRESLQGARGRDTDVSQDYLASLIVGGWSVRQFTTLLECERQLRASEVAMANLNEILAFQGQEPLTADQMVDFLMEGEEFEAFELINDALRGAALEEQGIDLTAEQLEALGEGAALGVAAVGAFSEQARAAALEIGANLNDIQRGKLGITQEQIIAVMFQDTDLLPAGTSLADTELTLQQLGRERQAAGRGTGGPTAFQDNQGRLRIPGLA